MFFDVITKNPLCKGTDSQGIYQVVPLVYEILSKKGSTLDDN